MEGLKELPDRSIHCCVTSPPYWGLRDYGTSDQLGLEETPGEYVANIVKLFRQVRRVLKDDGTLWLNLGDSYATSPAGNTKPRWEQENKGLFNINKGPAQQNYFNEKNQKKDWKKYGIKPKDLIGIPWRVAFALQADGWYLRQDIIWHKPNPMPESVTDRCTKSHEYIFLLTKSAKYYYDVDAIREPSTIEQKIKSAKPSLKNNGIKKPYAIVEAAHRKEIIEYRNLPPHEEIRQYLAKWRSITIEQVEDHFGNQAGHHWFEKNGSYPSDRDWVELKKLFEFDNTYDKQMTEIFYKSGLKQNHPDGRNKRSVWTVTTKPYKEAHFATYPEKLIEPCIKAGCPKGGTVLDPFMGAGTTGLVARKLSRHYVGYELNAEYIKIAEKRIFNEIGLFL